MIIYDDWDLNPILIPDSIWFQDDILLKRLNHTKEFRHCSSWSDLSLDHWYFLISQATNKDDLLFLISGLKRFLENKNNVSIEDLCIKKNDNGIDISYTSNQTYQLTNKFRLKLYEP